MKTKSRSQRRLPAAIKRLQAVATFRASELRYRRLFETAHDGVLLIDPGTRKIVDANPFMIRLLGYPRRQLVGKELFEIGLLKDERASQEMFRKLKRKHEVRYEDLPLESRAGRHQEVEVVANLYQEDGHAIIQCNIRDITERKAAELVSNRLGAIVKFSDDAIIGKDTNGIVTSWNNGATRIFGYTAREMLGSSMIRLIPADRQHEERIILARIRRSESVEHFETVRQTKLGRLINVSVTISPIKDGSGRIIGISKVARDITEQTHAEATQRKAVEAALKKSEHHYGQLLAESDRLQEQLRQLSRQILLAQEDERKRISRELHDVIAQTLTGINIRLATLKKEASVNTRGLERNIARTQKLVEKSVDIVHRFARELRPAVLDDLGLIPALHSFVKTFALRTHLKIHLAAFAEVEALDMAKRTVLFRVAQEALTNVARHAKAKHVELVVGKTATGVSLKVKDDGKSFQVARVLGGAGSKRLGLLGMRERVEMVGGTFCVESAPGQGTTISVEIPFAKVRPSALKKSKTSTSLECP